MIIGIGTDIVDCERIRKIIEKFGRHFINRILTLKEQEQIPSFETSLLTPWLAARFAVKEATVKALGTGFSEGISFLHIEVLREKNKAPILSLLANALDKANSLGVKFSHVSYSHEQKFAIAYVVLEK